MGAASHCILLANNRFEDTQVTNHWLLMSSHSHASTCLT